MKTGASKTKAWLLTEFLLLYLALPGWLCVYRPGPVLPILWGVTLLCIGFLLRDPEFDRNCLWNKEALESHGGAILRRFLIFSLALFVVIYLLAPELLFNLLRTRPLIWALVIVLYPLLSVYPQELLYRTYFFHRYQRIFPNTAGMITVSALSFGYMHIIFHNWIAVLLTLFGGFLFAVTYHRTRSTLLVSIEHALFGCFVFTAGLGRFFYHGVVFGVSSIVSF